LYGTEYLVKYNFQKGYSYSFTFTLEAGTNASITGFPTLYFGLTNSSSLGTDCSGPEAPINITGDNQLVSASVPIPAFTGTSSMNTTVAVNMNSLSAPYQFLNISTLLPGTGNDGLCQVYIKNLTIVATSTTTPPSCSLAAPTGETTQNGGTLITWNPVSGAASYNIAVTIPGSPTPEILTSTTNSVYVCNGVSGDPITYTVQSVCSGGVAGGKSGTYVANYTAQPALTAPTNVSFNPAPPYTVSWSPVAGATGYWYQTTHSAPVFVSGTSITDPNAELSFGQTYQVTVSATNGCSTVASGSITAVMPAACTLSPPTNLTTSNNGTVLNWGAVSGASSYEIVVTDDNSGTPDVSTLTSSTNSVSFCPAANGDNVSFTVQSRCAGGAAGVASGAYSYTYTAVPIPAPMNLAFNSAPPYTVSWTAVTGATGYYYMTGNSSPVLVSGTSISDPNAELSLGVSTTVQVAAVTPCGTGPYTTPLPVTIPICNAPSVAVVEGTYVILYSVSGASSYNIGFENSNHTLVYQVDNIPTSTATSGYNVPGVPSGQYYVVGQTNCSNGLTSAWGPAYDNALTYVSTRGTLDSSGLGTLVNISSGDSSSVFSIYPNPARSEVNIVYGTTQTGPADISIISEFGNTIVHKLVTTVAGQNNYILALGNLANGVYIVKITDGKSIRFQKLIVAK
jgi:hypothetical protein